MYFCRWQKRDVNYRWPTHSGLAARQEAFRLIYDYKFAEQLKTASRKGTILEIQITGHTRTQTHMFMHIYRIQHIYIGVFALSHVVH